MNKNAPQAEKGILPCNARKDTSVAVSKEDNDYLEQLTVSQKTGSKRETLAKILQQHRAGATA